MDKVRSTFLIPAVLLAAGIITRLPFTSKLLYHMDSVQYALGIEHYSITTHQPHPPGYFLYVMLGRLVNSFVHDANRSFVILSIFFGALAVVLIYLLGKRMFDEKIALLASLLALTSPNFWFHGEIAMNYIIEAFFSVLIALLCWEIRNGKDRHIWLLAVVLALSGGVRQNTPVFLLPLVIYSVGTVPGRRILAAGLLCAAAMLAWFIPMVVMTGGLDAYVSAFSDLWHFSTGHNSVFEKGFSYFILFFMTLINFTTLSLGAGLILLAFTFYYVMRNRQFSFLTSQRYLFIALWISPSWIFYQFIFIHPANPGYILLIFPPLVFLTAKCTDYISTMLMSHLKINFRILLSSMLIGFNLYIFLFSKCPTSRYELTSHDAKLSSIITQLKQYDPSSTAFFVGSYVFYGYRHIMYYLPEFTVCDPVGIGPPNDIRSFISGTGKQTLFSKRIFLENRFTRFATLVNADYRQRKFDATDITINEFLPETYVASGNIALVTKVYPKLLGWVVIGQSEAAPCSSTGAPKGLHL